MSEDAIATPDPMSNQLSPERGLSLLRTMRTIRAFELAAWEALKRGEIYGTLHLCIGQEAVAAGVCHNLVPGDLVTSTHRGHGHAIAKGADPAAMMAELFGRATGTCRGKGGSMHIADFSVGMLGANGVVAGGLAIAVGAAHALRLRGVRNVVVPFFGDGAVNRGPFLEALNWAKVFALPVVFVCEDNGFAAFTRPGATTAGAGAAARAEALGIPARSIDGNDASLVDLTARELIEAARGNGGPQLLYCRTYRLEGHTVADAGTYRSERELAERRREDPIERLVHALGRAGVPAAVIAEVEQAVQSRIERAILSAREAAWPEAAEALTDVQDAGAPAWQ